MSAFGDNPSMSPNGDIVTVVRQAGDEPGRRRSTTAPGRSGAMRMGQDQQLERGP